MAGMDHLLSKGYLGTDTSTGYTFGQLVAPAAGTVLQPNQIALAVAGAGGAGAVSGVVLGVCMENQDASKVGFEYLQVALEGIVDVIWDGVGTAGIGLPVLPSVQTAGATNNGRVTFGTWGSSFVGKACVGVCVGNAGDAQAGLPQAAGDIFKILLTPGNRV